MDEHAKTELHLSDEQLQQITGGCGECTYNAHVRDLHQEEADKYHWRAEADAARGSRGSAKQFAKYAKDLAREAKAHQAAIDARRGTPGHPPVLGESSISVLDINRLRL